MNMGNFVYLSSLSGIFRLLTVITGVPTIVLAWIAYFSSSWTNVFPEILAIIAVEKTLDFNQLTVNSVESTGNSSESDSSSEELDIISDTEEDYLDDILLQTLMYEKFFIGMVSVVFLISAAYLMVRVFSKHHPDSPYEIMFDFIFHVFCALLLLTGSGLVLLSAAKIQNFVDKVNDRDGFAPPEILEIIHKNQDNVQDKADKIAAAVLGMLNGVFYSLCVVTLRMAKPIKCKRKKKQVPSLYVLPTHLQQQYQTENDTCSVSMVLPFEYQHENGYGFYGYYEKQDS